MTPRIHENPEKHVPNFPVTDPNNPHNFPFPSEREKVIGDENISNDIFIPDEDEEDNNHNRLPN
jgi:hypothetical protein